MPSAERSIFVRVHDGPRGERRYRAVARTDDVHEARRIRNVLEQTGHTAIIQADRRPPNS